MVMNRIVGLVCVTLVTLHNVALDDTMAMEYRWIYCHSYDVLLDFLVFVALGNNLVVAIIR